MRKILPIALTVLSIILLLSTIALIGIQIYGNKMVENAGRVEEWNESDGTLLSDLAYAPHSLNTYDLYIPHTLNSSDTTSCLLYLHGGSWTAGDKEEGNWFSRRFAKQGCLTATMNYSLISVENPSVCIPTMLKEITHCITSIQQEAANRGITLQQIALAGYSAGAHLAMLYAYSMAAASPIPIPFCVSMAGPTDLSLLFSVPADTLRSIQSALQQGTPHTSQHDVDALAFICSGKQLTSLNHYAPAHLDSLIQQASPLSWAKQGAVPTILAHGEHDRLVSPQHSKRLAASLDSLGVQHIYIPYPQSDHLLAHDTASVAYLNKAITHYIKTLLSPNQR